MEYRVKDIIINIDRPLDEHTQLYVKGLANFLSAVLDSNLIKPASLLLGISSEILMKEMIGGLSVDIIKKMMRKQRPKKDEGE